jgi:hypothetical protein
MSPKISFVCICGPAVALLAVSLAAAPAVAGNDRHAAMTAHRVQAATLHRHRHYLVHGAFPSPYAQARYDRAGVTPFYGPGYVFVPGRGILGAACNLPSSAYSNEYRDIQ